MSVWRTSLRIAVREARRAKGRTAMVLVLISLPVLGLAFAAVTYDMFDLRPSEKIDRQIGAADAKLQWYDQTPVKQNLSGDSWTNEQEQAGPGKPFQPTERDVLAQLPAGSTVIPMSGAWVDMRTAAGIGSVEVVGIDAASPLAKGIVTVLDGRAPKAGNEVALSRKAMDRMGAHVGGTVQDAARTKTYSVVGVVESPSNLGELMVTPPDLTQVGGWLVDTPGPVLWSDVRQLNAQGIAVASRSVNLDPPANPEGVLPENGGGHTDGLQIAAVIGGLGLFEVVLLAGPAFAIGARRRRRELALVSANGGTPAHLRRIVLADGIVLGLAGAVFGIALGAIGAVIARPLVEVYVAGERAGGYRFFPVALALVAALALVTGVLAALVPAVSAARQDVVAALTGRRGALRSRRRWVVLGVLLVVFGGLVAVAGALTSRAVGILGGLVLAELGLVLITPALVGVIASLGRSLPLGPRIALRDTARNRAAAAPAISAVMAAVASCVALGTFLASDTDRQVDQYRTGLPLGYAAIQLANADKGVPTPERVAAAAAPSLAVTGVQQVDGISCPKDGTGESQWCYVSAKMPAALACPFDRNAGELPAEQQKQALADPRCKTAAYQIGISSFNTVVGSGANMAALSAPSQEDLRGAATVLAAGGAVVSDPNLLTDGKLTLEVRGDDGSGDGIEKVLRTATVAGYALRTGVEASQGPPAIGMTQRIYVSPAAVAALGLSTVPEGFVVSTAKVPDQAAQDRLAAAVAELPGRGYASIELGAPTGVPLVALVLAAAAIIVALGATFVATGLAAADGRADLSTLAAIGAAPSMRRVLTLSQAGVIAGLGSLLGTVAGLGTGWAILASYNRGFTDHWPQEIPYPFAVPGVVLLLLVSIPVIAMLGTGLVTRARLPIERRAD
ncbi:lipoprotein release ABC transporter permease [Asanoa ishikariensis]|uniref:Putative ABC transport system permease protein n=1 Tax=Asanoa ishikariensis TaxID=137265 RepID=A0A1H3RN96_9ACTN|nr:ABC transporter permease [Asanoa ishikariensis]GIF67062.1 lipoprotein release ABC transporter permease [Asanoa ishikariensis]SDZ26718.1 putative ABC transport system permease protein [Asanoa ishikariensis]